MLSTVTSTVPSGQTVQSVHAGTVQYHLKLHQVAKCHNAILMVESREARCK